MSQQSEENNEMKEVGQFLLFSDVHLDPFYGTPNAKDYDHGLKDSICAQPDAPTFSYYGCDSNEALFESAMVNAAQIAPKPDFILFNGDGTRHSLSSSNLIQTDEDMSNAVKGTIGYIFDTVRKEFPDVSTISLPPMDLGNNDFQDDYQLQITSTDPCFIQDNGDLPPSTNPWLQNIASDFQNMFINQEEAAVFACGGYLAREVTEDLVVIVLNTVLWSTELNFHRESNPNEVDYENPFFDPFGQHSWLETTLANLRREGKHAYITGHIPPIVMSFTEALGENLMYETHVNRYIDMISQYEDVVSGQFFGHVHSNELRRIPGEMNRNHPPMMVSGSMSPCYHSRPFFHIVEYDKAGNKFPLDLATYYADLDNVKLLSTPNEEFIEFQPLFTSVLDFLGMSEFTNDEIRKLSNRLVVEDNNSGDKKWHQFWDRWYKGNPQKSCKGTCRVAESCVMTCGMRTESWQTCVMNSDGSNRNIVNPCALATEVYTPSNTMSLLSVTGGTESSSAEGRIIVYGAIAAMIIVIFISFLFWACISAMKLCRRMKDGSTKIDDINIDVNIDLNSTITNNGSQSLDLSLPAIS